MLQVSTREAVPILLLTMGSDNAACMLQCYKTIVSFHKQSFCSIRLSPHHFGVKEWGLTFLQKSMLKLFQVLNVVKSFPYLFFRIRLGDYLLLMFYIFYVTSHP